MVNLSLFVLLLFTAILTVVVSSLSLPPLPLYTQSRWIHDASGRRLKLGCVNWPAHLQPVVAEGLSHQPLDAISKRIVGMGFNCVRLTWPLYLVTNKSLDSLTVQQSLAKLNLQGAITGFEANNRRLLNLRLIDAFKAVVASLGSHGLMVILDNHMTMPGWCCRVDDGNGFFGDRYFKSDLWVGGLSKMAGLFRGVAHVVAMSLRNELRGSKQNARDWYRYMEQGARAVHGANPHLLVILSGLSFDTDLSFLRNEPLRIGFRDKIVFEIHWYKFTDKGIWEGGRRPERVKACRRVKRGLSQRVLYLLKKGYPLFVSEFGLNLSVRDGSDYRYLQCFSSVAGRLELGWAYWTLAGSYYLRKGVVELDEEFGLLRNDWAGPRNSNFLRMLPALQRPIMGAEAP